ncbi:MAG: hypothetical protein OEU74_07570, partial [Gammaproteobacteria bacterium]|nr:hypothetical protein [Gammaproteobacteria bacterium]
TNLETQANDASILSMGLIEVENGMTDASAYAERLGSNTLPFDIVWFTPKVMREDACTKLRQHFKPKPG